MAAVSCSRYGQATVYFILATALALIAISSFRLPAPLTAGDDTILTPNATTIVPALEIFHNASAKLGTLGFTIIASHLKLSPEIFLSPSSSSSDSDITTIFALSDSALANLSLPHWAQKLLFQYHTVPSRNFPFRALLRKASNTCLATAIPSKNIRLTKILRQERRIEINNVWIAHPDLFLEGTISIHGVRAPFTALDSQETKQYSHDFIHSPDCSDSAPIFPHWMQIIRELISRDFISFAVGLNSSFQGIRHHYPNMNSGTIFVPKELGLVDSPEPQLRRLVRYHIITKRYKFSDLASLPMKTRLKTLLSGKELEITGAFNASQKLVIGGVDVKTPAVFSTRAFVVLEISRAFDPDAHSHSR